MAPSEMLTTTFVRTFAKATSYCAPGQGELPYVQLKRLPLQFDADLRVLGQHAITSFPSQFYECNVNVIVDYFVFERANGLNVIGKRLEKTGEPIS